MLRPSRLTGLIRALSLGGLTPPSIVRYSHPEIWVDRNKTSRHVRRRKGRSPASERDFGSYLFRVPAEGKTSPTPTKKFGPKKASLPGYTLTLRVETITARIDAKRTQRVSSGTTSSSSTVVLLGRSSQRSADRATIESFRLGVRMLVMQMIIVILGALLSVLALLLASCAVYQWLATWRDRRRFPPPGRLVRVNNRLMHMHATGQGTPTVVFESGMGASCLSWTLVQPAVAEFSRAVSYDRAGHGWSDPAYKHRTAQQIAQELRALLNVSGVPGPYVLVAHSFGGYVSRAFSHLPRRNCRHGAGGLDSP